MLERALCDALQTLVPEWPLADVEVVSFLEGGYSNNNYRIRYKGRDYALRTPGDAQPFVDRLHEAQWLHNLPKDIGLRPVAFDVASGCMLSNWIEGTLLADYWQDQEAFELVTYLRQLHTNLPDAGRHYELTPLLDAYGVDEYVARPLSSYPVLTTCHNDLNPWNILVTSEGWVTLDWEFVGHNDPLFDLVSMHQGLELPEGDLEALAFAYLQQDYDPARLENCIHNFWLREFGWAKYQLRVGNTRSEIHAQYQSALNHLRQ